MKIKLQKAAYWASVSVIGVIIGISLQFAKAWSEPLVGPPFGNIGAPINTGATQEKTGGLVLNYTEIKSGGEPTINFHRPGIFATGIKLRSDNNLWLGGWSAGEGTAGLVAGRMYDGDNTGYYVDPSGTSRTNYTLSNNTYTYGWIQTPNNMYANDFYISSTGRWASSLSAADNMGNHTATQTLNMNGNQIVNAGNFGAATGVQGTGWYMGVFGNGSYAGVQGNGTNGVIGNGSNYGVLGSGASIGVLGKSSGYGVYGYSVSGIAVKGYSYSGLAGEFSGKVEINGHLVNGGLGTTLPSSSNDSSCGYITDPSTLVVFNNKIQVLYTSISLTSDCSGTEYFEYYDGTSFTGCSARSFDRCSY